MILLTAYTFYVSGGCLNLQDKKIKEQKYGEKLDHDMDDYFRKKSLQNLNLQSQRYIIQNQKLNRQEFLFANLDNVSSILRSCVSRINEDICITKTGLMESDQNIYGFCYKLSSLDQFGFLDLNLGASLILNSNSHTLQGSHHSIFFFFF